MNAVLMSHPKHGLTNVYDTGEINRLKGLGWSVGMPPEPVAEPIAEPVVAEVVEVKRKPGRPKGK